MECSKSDADFQNELTYARKHSRPGENIVHDIRAIANSPSGELSYGSYAIGFATVSHSLTLQVAQVKTSLMFGSKRQLPRRCGFDRGCAIPGLDC